MSTYVPADLRRRIRARFADRCAYCLTAEALVAAIFEIEHIIPRSVGGETVFDNLCLACPTCNRYGSIWIPGSYVSKSSSKDSNNALPRRLTL
jgi:5-methylcytosine-specific restriction endonuclease McrA